MAKDLQNQGSMQGPRLNTELLPTPVICSMLSERRYLHTVDLFEHLDVDEQFPIKIKLCYCYGLDFKCKLKAMC
jgi:hypothetical protein